MKNVLLYFYHRFIFIQNIKLDGLVSGVGFRYIQQTHTTVFHPHRYGVNFLNNMRGWMKNPLTNIQNEKEYVY